jgi:hypothetical protein
MFSVLKTNIVSELPAILFKNLREQLSTTLGKTTGKNYYVTTAVGGNVDYISTQPRWTRLRNTAIASI